MNNFNPDKADEIITLMENLFLDDPETAAFHCAAILIGLIGCDDCAMDMLAHVIDLKKEFEQYCAECENENTTSH